MKLIVPKVKHRPAGHRALFDDTLPFKARTERRRDVYQRKNKHQKKLVKDWSYDFC